MIILLYNKYILNLTMKLIMAEHPEKGIWYFSTRNKAANWLGVSPVYINHILKGVAKTAKGWRISLTEDGDILNKYIDPKK